MRCLSSSKAFPRRIGDQATREPCGEDIPIREPPGSLTACADKAAASVVPSQPVPGTGSRTGVSAPTRVIEQLWGVVALPKFAVPKTCWQGYFLDAEGNTFGIFQVDANAK